MKGHIEGYLERNRGLAAASIAALVWALPAGAAGPDFASWLNGVFEEGLERGISKATLEATLAGLEPLP
ncbi:MAG: hypothetical protein V3U93_09980, partial [Alphaproteobacteria bacterium]